MKVKAVFAAGIQMLQAGDSLELVHIERSSGSTPRGSDAWMLVNAEGKSWGTIGGGAVEYQGTLDARQLLQEKKNGSRSYTLTREAAAGLGMVCGGDIEVSFRYLDSEGAQAVELLAELIRAEETQGGMVYLFGGGHVSEEVCQLLDHLDFQVTVFDDRESFVSPDRFPGAKRLVCASYEDVCSQVQPGPEDYVLIMTRGHQYDYQVQKQLLRCGSAYIGVIGSRKKLASVEERLLEDGFSREEIEGCYAPIGIQIAAEKPEEIAVSIAAELILMRARREGRRKVLEHKTIPYK